MFGYSENCISLDLKTIINHLKITQMNKTERIDLLTLKIKDLEWAEDYHTRKLYETEMDLEMYRKELANLNNE